LSHQLGAAFTFCRENQADTSLVRTLFHVAHGVIIGIGALAVLATLLPSQWQHRRALRRLRRARNGDALIRLAEERALAELQQAPGPADRSRPLLVLAALASVTAAAIHGAVGPEHFREALRLGFFFVVLCAAQLALAASLLRRPSRPIVVVTVAINAGAIVLWMLTRTVGLPAGLAEIEPFGVLDTVSSAAELVAVGCCLGWLQREPAAAPRASRLGVRSLVHSRTAGGFTARQSEGS
jgi:hypothetical protein